jgi:hypothetical protein
MSNSILSTPSGRRCRQLTMALAAVAALSSVASTAQAKTNHHRTAVTRSAALHATKVLPLNPDASLANYAAGFMTHGNNVPQGENRYEPGFAGWANYARGYKASHPEDFPG